MSIQDHPYTVGRVRPRGGADVLRVEGDPAWAMDFNEAHGGEMLESTRSPRSTTANPAAGGVAIPVRPSRRWVLVTAVLLLVALGLALKDASAGRRALLAPSASRQRLVPWAGPSSLPLAAQGPISATLGRADSPFGVHASAAGLKADNPVQRLSEGFTDSGVFVTSGATRVGFSLRASGYGGSLRALARVSPTATANLVSYRYPGVEAWYANGPLGLEQGFTITRPPYARASGTLTLSIAVSGNARLALASDRQSVVLAYPGGSALRYGGLSATDSRGRELPSWIEQKNRELLVSVDTTGAHYPLKIDPLIQQGKKLTAPGTSFFGREVALSGDGTTALISSLGGAVYVFTRSGSTWSHTATLTLDRGGGSVALSADGNTALLGEPGPCCSADSSGGAWIFTRSRSTWTQVTRLTSAEATSSFGSGVALSSDGNSALIGDVLYGKTGAAWVFTRSGSSWTQQSQELTPSERSIDFGASVALSSHGDTALIGEWSGGAWVFTRSGSTWTQQAKRLKGAGASGRGESRSLALSAEGNTALIGAPTEGAGAAWVFTRSGSTWTQQGKKLTGGEGSELARFGSSVALSSNGNTALIGGPENARGFRTARGAAWVFIRAGSTWTQQGKKLTGAEVTGPVGPDFGTSVALSSNGKTALIGGPYDHGYIEAFTGAAWGAGAAWVFVFVAESPGTVSHGAQPPVTRTPQPATQAPTLSRVAQSHRVWRPGSKLARLAKRRPPVGTSFSFTVSQAATVTFTFSEQIKGRRVHHRCVVPTRRNRRKPRCTRSLIRGVLSFTVSAGAHKLAVEGRLSRKRRLRAGTYTLRIVARNAAEQTSQPAQLSFKIVK
jgi:hypothetical protein